MRARLDLESLEQNANKIVDGSAVHGDVMRPHSRVRDSSVRTDFKYQALGRRSKVHYCGMAKPILAKPVIFPRYDGLSICTAGVALI